MEFKIYLQNSDNIKFSDIINNKGKYIKELNDKNENLTTDDIIYGLSDLIDNGIIEIEEIKKIYKIDTNNFFSIGSGKKPYIIYQIKILVKLLDKTKIEEYCNFRDDYFEKAMSEIYNHHILNKICSKNSKYSTIDEQGRRLHNQPPYDEFDEFDLQPNFCVWINNNDIKK